MAGTELAKAYVQIIPSAQGISGKIQQAIDPEAEPAGASFGGKLVGKLKGIIATAAIGKALSAQKRLVRSKTERSNCSREDCTGNGSSVQQ